jgi:acyl transferase domain-containing protein
LLSGKDAVSPEYWARHVRETVRFFDGVRFLVDMGVTRFLEVGPDRTLAGLVAGCVEDAGAGADDGASAGAGAGNGNGGGVAGAGNGNSNGDGGGGVVGGGVFVAAGMRPGVSQEKAFLAALAGAHVHGVRVDWGVLLEARGVLSYRRMRSSASVTG